jgi:AraC family transcriptional regulator
MNSQHPYGIGAIWELSAGRPHEWMKHVMALLDAAIDELDREEHPAKCTVLQAVSLLRGQIDPQSAVADAEDLEEGERLLAWQVRKVREYVDGHIAGPIRVAELSALIQRSEGHFSRACKRTFGVSPHAFVIQRRLELAALYMLETDACLSDIALSCGFSDQAHLCKQFRHSTGHTPAAWRRARRTIAVHLRMEERADTEVPGGNLLCERSIPGRSGKSRQARVLLPILPQRGRPASSDCS